MKEAKLAYSSSKVCLAFVSQSKNEKQIIVLFNYLMQGHVSVISGVTLDLL